MASDSSRCVLWVTLTLEASMFMFIASVGEILLKISSTDHTIASALVRQGVMPCSPISPVAGITLETLELYRVTHLRSPHLSIQVFVKTICDLHEVVPVFSLQIQILWCFILNSYYRLNSTGTSHVNSQLHSTRTFKSDALWRHSNVTHVTGA